MRRPPLTALPLLAAATAAAAIAGCSPRTYGTGQAPEMALFREVTGGLMSREKKQPIQYQPRAPLVMPPSPGQLPEPVQTADAASADWPLDPDQTAEAAASDEFDPQAEYKRLKPLAGVMPRREGQETRPEENIQPAYDIVGDKQKREQFAKALAESKGYGRTERKYLTDPPTAYRAPAETAPMEEVKGKGGGGTGWLLGWFRRG